jgi:hypothetical protein
MSSVSGIKVGLGLRSRIDHVQCIDLLNRPLLCFELNMVSLFLRMMING